jgi:hypothetical protein
MKPIPTLNQELPYSKTDNVADLDKPRPIKPRKPAKRPASVPERKCDMSGTCTLRKAGKGNSFFCGAACDYVAGGE